MAEKKTVRAVRILADKTTKVEDIELPELTDDDVLIKVEASSINPVDVAIAKSLYPGAPKPPHTLGLEGAGTLVEVGKSHAHRFKAGDRVVFFTFERGAWAEYVLVPGKTVFHMHPNNSFEEAAPHFVNPMTVLMMLREVQSEGHKAVVQSAASSTLGRMFIKLFKAHGIKTINLVRRDDVKDELLRIGADYVLSTKDEDFEQKLEELVKKENPTKFYDAVGGELTVKVLRKLPFGSTISVYGFLAEDQRIPLLTYDLFAGKTLNVFFGSAPFEKLPFEEKEKAVAYIQENLKTLFHSKVIKTFGLDNYAEGLEHVQKFASEGKTLIKP